MRSAMRTRAILVVKGIAMGTADVIPGISGGTVAFITGIYETLIDFLSSVGMMQARALLMLFQGSRKRKAGIEIITSLNWGFFIPLVTGIAIAILSLSKIIVHVMETYPVQTYAFFFGLILYSVKYPFEEMRKDALNFVIILCTAALAFLFFSVTGNFEGDVTNLAYVFMCGAIGICALILPGISGSTLLVMLGMYKPILNALHSRDIVTVSVFILGMTVGILSFVRLLKWLLKHYHSFTMAGLTGLMVGSLKKVWPIAYATPDQSNATVWGSAGVFALLGVFVIYALDRVSKPMKDLKISSQNA